MNTIQHKHYAGFIKAAVQSGVPYASAAGMYKQAFNLGFLKTLGQGAGKAKQMLLPGMEAAAKPSMMSQIGNAAKPYGRAAGIAGLAGGGATAGYVAGQDAGFDQGNQFGQDMASPISMPSQTPPPEGLPEWAKYLMVGGGAGALGAGGAMAMAPNREEEELQQRMSAHPLAQHMDM